MISVQTGSPGQAVALAARGAQAGYAAIVAAGGDGTINEVINGVAAVTPDSQPLGPVAVYPIGTGNDFAHTLKRRPTPFCWRRDLRAAARAGSTWVWPR